MTVEQLLIVIDSLAANSISASTGRCVECGEAANMGTSEQFAHGNGCDTDVAIRLLQHELFTEKVNEANRLSGLPPLSME